MIDRQSSPERGGWAEHRVGADESGRTVEEILRGPLGISGRRIQRLTRSRGIRLNGRNAHLDGRVRDGDVVACRVLDGGARSLEGEPVPITVLYEDADLLVLNKPAGILVHPVRGERDTLAHGVAAYLGRGGAPSKVHPVHRLDRDTSGAVLFAKSAVVQHRFDERQRQATSPGFGREYLALVQGVIGPGGGLIDAPIGRHPTRRGLRAVRPNGGVPAVTRYEVVEGFADATLLRAWLETGRTHQIRVHLAHLGHPLLGDRAYGGRVSEIGRQALHAWRLSFPHPSRPAELVEVRAPVPEELEVALERARAG